MENHTPGRQSLIIKLSQLPKRDRKAIERQLPRIQRNYVRGELRKIERSKRNRTSPKGRPATRFSPAVEALIFSVTGPGEAHELVKPAVKASLTRFLKADPPGRVTSVDGGGNDRLAGRAG